MTMQCSSCDGTGFLNTHQIVDKNVVTTEDIIKWLVKNTNSDVSMCTCCGDGDEWYGVAGEHDNGEENYGVYEYNGGLPECY